MVDSPGQSRWHAVWLLFSLLSVLAGQSAAAEGRITLSTHGDPVYPGDSIIIDVTATGLLDALDTTPLNETARLIRQTQGTRIAVVDGQVVDILSRRLEFAAGQPGTLLFGPLHGESSAGPVRSNTLAVTVLPAPDTDWSPQPDDASLSATVSSQTPWVGEEVVLDIVLRHRYPLADEQIRIPALDGFDHLALVEARRTLDGDWRQTAWRWLLHPQHSGEVTIGPVRWQATLLRSRLQRAAFSRASRPIRLTVKAAATDDWWLPATDVRLRETWSRELLDLTAGDEIVRQITVEADGVLPGQLPTITPLPSQGFSSRLIDTQRSHRRHAGTLTATATFSYRMIAQRPMPVFLDTVRLPWWRVSDDTPQESLLPARRVDIGVPARDDLLAGLHAQQSLLQRLRLWAMGQLRWESALALLTGLAVLTCSLPTLRHIAARLQRQRRHRRRWRAIEQLARQGESKACYRALLEHLAAAAQPVSAETAAPALKTRLWHRTGGPALTGSRPAVRGPAAGDPAGHRPPAPAGPGLWRTGIRRTGQRGSTHRSGDRLPDGYHAAASGPIDTRAAALLSALERELFAGPQE